MKRIIKSIDEKHLEEAVAFVEKVFTEYADEQEGKLVGKLVEEIRSKKYYVPELEHIHGEVEYSFYEALR